MFRTLFIIMIFPFAAFAAQFTGIGYGTTQDAARTNALSDLSAQILVEVRSEITISEDASGSNSGHREVSAIADVPVIGAEITYSADTQQYQAKAVLDSARSLPAYEKTLTELAAQIRSALEQTYGKSGQAAIETLEKAYAKADTYEKTYAAALILGSSYIKDRGFSAASIAERLIELEKTATNLEEAVFILTKDIVQKNIYVLPPAAPSSSEVTQFAEAVQSVIEGSVNSVETPAAADYKMSGEYAVQGKSIILTYRLISLHDGLTAAARTVRLAPSAFAGLDYLPKTADFDRLLKNGVAVSKDFRVNVSTDKGSENLLFKNAEKIELLVKTTAPAYVYAVGHTMKKKERYSYLLEFQNAEGSRRFVRFINADDANKWVSLGEFTVTKPFGVESIQVIASSKDPAALIPYSKKDASTGLYIIGTEPAKAVAAARALINTGIKKQQDSVSEAVLTFTTAE